MLGSTLATVHCGFIFHTLRLVRLITLDLYAAKPDIRPESPFLPIPPAYNAPVRGGGGFLLEYRHPFWHGKTRMVGLRLPEGEKISKIFLFVLTQLTNVTDTQTPHDGIGRAYASHRAAKIRQYLRKLCSNEKRSSFLTQCTSYT